MEYILRDGVDEAKGALNSYGFYDFTSISNNFVLKFIETS